LLAVFTGGLLIITLLALFSFSVAQETPVIKEEKTVTVEDVGDSTPYISKNKDSENKNNDTTKKTMRVVEEKANPKYIADPKSKNAVIIAYAILIGFFAIGMIGISKM
jgi:hypothetical protein